MTWSFIRRLRQAAQDSLEATSGAVIDNTVAGATTYVVAHVCPPAAIPFGTTAGVLTKNFRESWQESAPQAPHTPPLAAYYAPLSHPSLGPGFFAYTAVPQASSPDALWTLQPDHIHTIIPYYFPTRTALTLYLQQAAHIDPTVIRPLTDPTLIQTMQDLWMNTRHALPDSSPFPPFAIPVYFAARTDDSDQPGWFAWCPVQTAHGEDYGVMTNEHPWDLTDPPWVYPSLNDLTHALQKGLQNGALNGVWSGLEERPTELMQQLTLTATKPHHGPAVYTRTPYHPPWRFSASCPLDPQDTPSPSSLTHSPYPTVAPDWYLGSLPSHHTFAWQWDPEFPHHLRVLCGRDRLYQTYKPIVWPSMAEAKTHLAQLGSLTQEHPTINPAHTFRALTQPRETHPVRTR
jgi:hypothetical protein